LGIGDWGLGIGDWGLGPIPNPQSPIFIKFEKYKKTKKLKNYYFMFINLFLLLIIFYLI